MVGEALTVFSMPQIRKTGQCLAGQVDMTFLEIFVGNYNFLKFREALNVLFFTIRLKSVVEVSKQNFNFEINNLYFLISRTFCSLIAFRYRSLNNHILNQASFQAHCSSSNSRKFYTCTSKFWSHYLLMTPSVTLSFLNGSK